MQLASHRKSVEKSDQGTENVEFKEGHLLHNTDQKALTRKILVKLDLRCAVTASTMLLSPFWGRR